MFVDPSSRPDQVHFSRVYGTLQPSMTEIYNYRNINTKVTHVAMKRKLDIHVTGYSGQTPLVGNSIAWMLCLNFFY